MDGTGSGTRGPRTGGVKKVPGSGDSDPEVPKVTLYFESMLLYFESVLLWFESMLCYFERRIWYFESISCTLKVYFCTLKVHFCTLPQCLLQVALKINTARAKKRW